MSSSLLSVADGKALSEALQRDPSFWPALIKNPKAAYQAKFGKELLPGQEIEVVQDAPDRVTFVVPASGLRLPVQYSAAPGELSDEQLEAVAGGGDLGLPISQGPPPIVLNPVKPAPGPVINVIKPPVQPTTPSSSETFQEVNMSHESTTKGTQAQPGQAAIFTIPENSK